MMSDDVIFVSENIAIVQSQGFSCLVPSTISTQELSAYYGTVSLPIAKSKTIVEDQSKDIKLLYGSWVENGEEDKKLEELYESRLFPSIKLYE